MPRTDGRNLRRQQTRADLLRGARDLIEARGAANVAMDDVARAAGVSRRTVYDHFGSRAGLLLALAVSADEQMHIEERLTPVFAASSGRRAVRALLRVVADVTPPLLELATAFERARWEDPDAAAAWDDRMASRLHVCLHLAARLAEEGELRGDVSVEEAADIMYAAISWQLWHLLIVERRWSPDQWVARVAALLERDLMTTARGGHEALAPAAPEGRQSGD